MQNAKILTKMAEYGIIYKSANMRHDPLAQAVEHLTFNQGVRGSIPRWITKKRRGERSSPRLFLVIHTRTPLCARSAQNGVRIRRSKIDELARQAQSARIFAKGEIPTAKWGSHSRPAALPPDKDFIKISIPCPPDSQGSGRVVIRNLCGKMT